MVEMRVIEKLRAQVLTDYEFSWDKTYGAILARDDYNSNVSTSDNYDLFTQSVSKDSSSIYHCGGQTFNDGGSVTCTENGSSNVTLDGYIYKEFIFPFRYAYKTVLDGVGDGLLTYEIYSTGSTYGYNVNYYITPYIYLIARDGSGNDRTLGSVSMKQKSGNFSTTNGTTQTTGKLYIPYYLPIDNQTVDYNEKLILRAYFSIGSGTTISNLSNSDGMTFHIKLYTPLNTDELYINLPVVA